MRCCTLEAGYGAWKSEMIGNTLLSEGVYGSLLGAPGYGEYTNIRRDGWTDGRGGKPVCIFLLLDYARYPIYLISFNFFFFLVFSQFFFSFPPPPFSLFQNSPTVHPLTGHADRSYRQIIQKQRPKRGVSATPLFLSAFSFPFFLFSLPFAAPVRSVEKKNSKKKTTPPSLPCRAVLCCAVLCYDVQRRKTPPLKLFLKSLRNAPYAPIYAEMEKGERKR